MIGKIRRKSKGVLHSALGITDAATVPNFLTLLRLCSTPWVCSSIWTGEFDTAVYIFTAASVMDWLDGYIARNFQGQASVFGSHFDPVTDKIFMGAATTTLALKGIMPIPLFALIVARDLGLVAGGFYIRAKTKPEDARFFSTEGQGVMQVTPSLISKLNTMLSFFLVGGMITQSAFAWPGQSIVEAWSWMVGGTTVLSGADYALRSQDAFRVYDEEKK